MSGYTTHQVLDDLGAANNKLAAQTALIRELVQSGQRMAGWIGMAAHQGAAVNWYAVDHDECAKFRAALSRVPPEYLESKNG